MATILSSHFPLPFFLSQSHSFAKPFLFPCSVSFPPLRLHSSSSLKLSRTSFRAFYSNNSGLSSPFNDAFGSNPTPPSKIPGADFSTGLRNGDIY
ncbi:hypothetical protein V6N13_050161 [Hibiscus sabdariffa]|uniref:Uncharacterized protein n=1 Tax=Hibiscus sabdariffa TaxID=183260 RepID=A0ABR2QV24_9ROSI